MHIVFKAGKLRGRAAAGAGAGTACPRGPFPARASRPRAGAAGDKLSPPRTEASGATPVNHLGEFLGLSEVNLME